MKTYRYWLRYIIFFFFVSFLFLNYLELFVNLKFTFNRNKGKITSFMLHSRTTHQVSHSEVIKISPSEKIGHDNPTTILLGQFNYLEGSPSLFEEKWMQTKKFSKTLVAIPKIKKASHLIDNRGRIIYYQGDDGYVSPYANIARVIKQNKNTNISLLYVHDDLMVSGSLLERIGGKEWIVEDDFDGKTYEHTSGIFVQLYANKTYYTPRIHPKNLGWRNLIINECSESLCKMFNDSRLKPYLQKDKHGTIYFIFKYGQSDMLYLNIVSQKQRNELLVILDLFYEYKLFLECAIPTLVYMMQRMFDIRVHHSPLCTSWNYTGLRNYPSEMIKTCLKNKDVKFEVFHPIKMSESLDSWKKNFDQLQLL